MTTYLDPTPPIEGPTESPLVLVADDDPVQRQHLQLLLSQGGFRVVLAADCGEALERIVEVRPDLVLIDAAMPGGSGQEVVTTIRGIEGLETLPAIIVSGCGDLQAKVHSLNSGATDHLVKPVNGTELLARVRAHLRLGDTWATTVRRREQAQRAAFRVLAETVPGSDPFDTAARLLASMPAELACAAFAVVDGERLIPLAGVVAEPALGAVLLDCGARRGEPRQVAVRPVEHGCPVCGSAVGDGGVLITRVARSGTYVLVMLSGCGASTRDGARPLARVAADACAPVLGHQFHGWYELDSDRQWVDGVLAHRRFEVKFQPILDLATGRPAAFEALARFPDGVNPERAFARAATVGRSHSLEMAVVAEALRQARSLPPMASLHVNVSPMQVATSELIDLLRSTDRHVVVEITEHDQIDTETVDAFRAMAPSTASLAVDDVGAGYAGLSLLLRLRPDEIKIDREIVADVASDPARQALVAGLVRFARATGMLLVAEGIERAEELECLLSLGVDLGQGWLFAPALPVDEARTFHVDIGQGSVTRP